MSNKYKMEGFVFRNVLLAFSHHWRTYFFWSFFLAISHLLSELLPNWNLIPDEWGSGSYVGTITKVYSALYALGVPLLVNLFVNKLKNYKNDTPREYIVHHSEVTFFVVFTPVMVIYSILIQYFGLYGDIHVLLLTIVLSYSIFRLYRLADFCLAIAKNFDEMLSIHFEKRYDEILEKI